MLLTYKENVHSTQMYIPLKPLFSRHKGIGVQFTDEPTSGLDYKHMKEVANVLRQVRDTGITVYVITHDLELILDCCTDIVHFEDGSIIDQFPMDADGLEKIRNYFIKGVSVK